MESDKVNTVFEDLCVDMNVLDSCGQFLSDYKRLDLFDCSIETNTHISEHYRLGDNEQ